MLTISSSNPSREALRRQLRQKLRKTRRGLTPAARAAASQQVANHLLSHPWYRHARSIALYYPVGSEVDTHALFVAARQHDKRIFLPSILYRGGRLLFVHLQPGARLETRRHGIPQPRPSRSRDLAATRRLDLVVVPMLGFDASGHRLGSGAGYYDRSFGFLKFAPRNRPRLLGLGFACQQVKALQPDHWDVPLDAVVTEAGVMIFREPHSCRHSAPKQNSQ